AQYIAGSDPNHNDSAPSACEPFTVGKATPNLATTVKNAADDSTVTGALPLGSTVYDTASVTDSGFPFTGTVTFKFFSGGCTTSTLLDTQTWLAVGPKPSTPTPLPYTTHSRSAQYIAGSDPNHNDSAPSACEPFTVGKATPNLATTVKNAADEDRKSVA